MSYARSLGTDAQPDEYGLIVSSDGWSYQLTPDDILWLARSVDFEGGTSPAAVIWTYAQRFALPDVRRNYSTLKGLVRAHSQPINPIWSRTGSKCAPGGPYHGKPECSEARLARRDRASSIPWEEISPRVRDLVVKFSRAELPNPVPRSVEFAQGSESRGDTVTGYIGRNPAARVLMKAGNWFIGTARSLAWPDDHVTVRFGGRQSSELAPELNLTKEESKGALYLVLAAALGVAGYLVWKRTR
jgi:hypothetical protein